MKTVHNPQETTPKQIVKGWINSSTHRKGLLLSNAKSVGVAAVTVVSRDGYEANTWVLDFSSSKAKKVEKSKARKQFTKNIVTKNSYLKKSYLKLDSRYGTIWETEKNADEANISRQNDERVWCVSNGDQCIIFHIMEE